MNEIKPIIRICNGSKAWYADQRRMDILKDINLSIFSGESVALIGPSGAGKSTLLHVLGLLTPLDEGELWFDDILINSCRGGKHQRLRNHIGFVFQGGKLIPDLNVLENVCLPLSHRGIWPLRQKKMARRELERVGLEARMKHRLHRLSNGELMRVAIARAMVHNPRVVLADEPTGNLDSETGKEIAKLLLSSVEESKTVIMVTHNPVLAAMSDRMVFIKDGCIESHAA